MSPATLLRAVAAVALVVAAALSAAPSGTAEPPAPSSTAPPPAPSTSRIANWDTFLGTTTVPNKAKDEASQRRPSSPLAARTVPNKDRTEGWRGRRFAPPSWVAPTEPPPSWATPPAPLEGGTPPPPPPLQGGTPSPKVSSPPGPPRPPLPAKGATANEAFRDRSLIRVHDHAALEKTATTACEILRGWPMKVSEAVHQFLGSREAWEPPAIEALRAEVWVMNRLVQLSYQEILEGKHETRNSDAWSGFSSPLVSWPPGAEGWPGAEAWPAAGAKGWLGGCEGEVMQFTALADLYAGLLTVNPIEEDLTSPTFPESADQVGVAAMAFWRRRKARLDQLALRSNGGAAVGSAFGSAEIGPLLPPATVETCDKLIDQDNNDIQLVKSIFHAWKFRDMATYDDFDSQHFDFILSGPVSSLEKFVANTEYNATLQDTRRKLGGVGRRVDQYPWFDNWLDNKN